MAIALDISLLLGGASAQLDFKHFDPGKLAGELAKGKGQQIAHALSGGDAGIQALEKAGTAAAAAAKGGKVAGDVLKQLGASVAEEASANATAATTAATPQVPSLEAPAGNGSMAEQPPRPHSGDDLLHDFGTTLARAGKALDRVHPGDLQKQIEHSVSPELASELKPLAEALDEERPKLANALRHTDTQKVEEVIKGTDPREIEEVLSAYGRYRWARSHWPLLAAVFAAAVLVCAACSYALGSAMRPKPRSEALLVESEMSMWVRAGMGLAPVGEAQEESEAPELGFRQF